MAWQPALKVTVVTPLGGCGTTVEVGLIVFVTCQFPAPPLDIEAYSMEYKSLIVYVKAPVASSYIVHPYPWHISVVVVKPPLWVSP